MRIGELAERTGTTVRALRHYEQQELLQPHRQANGYRDYDATAVTRVRNIRLLLDAGLTLADVRGFGTCLDGDLEHEPHCPAALDTFRRRLDTVRRRADALQEVRGRLERQLDLAQTVR